MTVLDETTVTVTDHPVLTDCHGRRWTWDPGLLSWRHDDGTRTMLRDLAQLREEAGPVTVVEQRPDGGHYHRHDDGGDVCAGQGSEALCHCRPVAPPPVHGRDGDAAEDEADAAAVTR